MASEPALVREVPATPPRLVMDRLLRSDRLLLDAERAPVPAPPAAAPALGVLHWLLPAGLSGSPPAPLPSDILWAGWAGGGRGGWDESVCCSRRRAATVTLCRAASGEKWELEGGEVAGPDSGTTWEPDSGATWEPESMVLWEPDMTALWELHWPALPAAVFRTSANPWGQESR